jgi:hypothetical protein
MMPEDDDFMEIAEAMANEREKRVNARHAELMIDLAKKILGVTTEDDCVVDEQ